MPVLLNAVSADTVGSIKKVKGPTNIFIESSNLGGGTVTIYAQRGPLTPAISIGAYTANTVVTDSILGTHYLQAVLTGSSGADTVTVATQGT